LIVGITLRAMRFVAFGARDSTHQPEAQSDGRRREAVVAGS